MKYKITHLASTSHSRVPWFEHLTFETHVASPCAVSPQDCALQLQPVCMALLFLWPVMHGDRSTSDRRETPHLSIPIDLILASPYTRF